MQDSRHARIAVLALGALLSACAELPDIEKNVCGNSIREAGEACDGYVEQDSNQYCRPPGSRVGECRFDCAPGHECPAGYACGDDELCRLGSDSYAAWGSPTALSATRLLLGDFDGDKRDDLVSLGNPNDAWQAVPKILFFDADAQPRSPFEPKFPIASPSVVDLDPSDSGVDPRAQLLFTTTYGLASVSAASNRVVLPDPYPFQALDAGASYRVATISGLSTTALGDGVLVLYGTESETILLAADAGIDLGSIPKPIESLVGPLLTANLDPSSPCSEFVYAFDDGPAVYALCPCNALGQWQAVETAPRVLVALDDGHEVGGQLLTGRVNDDDALDLLLQDETGQAYVSFGLGDGRFAANPDNAEATLGQAAKLSFEWSECRQYFFFEGYPLTLGDLNSDGRTDWVLPGGVVLTKTLSVDETSGQVTVAGCSGNTPSVGQWASAKIDDFNRDDLPDLVAAGASDPDLDFFLGTGAERMNCFGIPTDGIVSHLVSGDFDGDLIVDLAFAAQDTLAADDADAGESVFVAFGEMSGAPTEVTKLGSFRNLRELCSANYVDTDAVSELGVVSQRQADMGEELAVFIGNAGQRPIAPLGLAIVSAAHTNYFDDPLAVALGRFLDEDTTSAIALGVACADGPCSRTEFRLWRSVYRNGVGFERPLASLPLPEDFTPVLPSGQGLSLHLAAGDLLRNRLLSDPSQADLDELLVLSPGSEPNTVSLRRMKSSAHLFSLRPDEEASTLVSPLGSATMVEGTLLANAPPALLDLDLDGFLDLVVLLRLPSAQNVLQVAWNDGAGNLTFAEPRLIDFDGEEPLGLAASEPSAPSRLLAITAKHVYEVPLAEHDREARDAQRVLETSGGSALPGGNALALGDMTGDGLLDLAISTRGTLALFSEVETLP